MGKTPERKLEKYWNNGILSWISIADIKNNSLSKTKEMISQSALDTVFKGMFSPVGTLIMSFKLSIGKTAILNIDATHNEAIISIYPFAESAILKKWLLHILPIVANKSETVSAIKGRTLNSRKIDLLEIALPPVAEQIMIIATIEQLNQLFQNLVQ